MTSFEELRLRWNDRDQLYSERRFNRLSTQEIDGIRMFRRFEVANFVGSAIERDILENEVRRWTPWYLDR